MDTIEVLKLTWYDDNINVGLWDNNNKIAIHWPIFKNFYDIDEDFKWQKHAKQFYISYDDKGIETMDFCYFDLNDIVFINRVYKDLKKAQVYTTINVQ